MDNRKPTSTGSFFSPSALLKRGWSGVSSPIAAVKDSVLAATPRSMLTPSTPSSTRAAQPSPAEYPRLFDVRASARGADGTGASFFGGDAASGGGGSRTSSRTSSSGSAAVEPQRSVELMDNDERALLEVGHHNLHSVLANPKASSWGGALLDVFAPLEPDLGMLPFPGLEPVHARDFEPYLRRFGKNAKRYEENHTKPISEQLSSKNVPSISVADEDVAKCLELVPSMFFRPNFDLTDPAIFEEVMGLQTSSTLQEELSGYLDRVEFTLLRQVSSRSDRFFEASANQEVMKRSISVACDQVATLRTTMDRLRNGLADKTLDIVSLHRRQKRVAELHEVVTMIESVKNAESAVDALVQCQDYTSALDLIETAQATLREHLKGIHGLGSLSDKFDGYRGFIVAQISQRFISLVTSPEWMFHEDELHAADRSRRDSSERDAPTAETKQLIEVLFRLEAVGDVVAKYREQLNEEIKVVVKTVVTETIAVSSSSATGGADGSNASALPGAESKVSLQLRALKSDEFLQCVQMIFEHLVMVLKRAVVVQELLVAAMQAKIDRAAQEDASVRSRAAAASSESLESRVLERKEDDESDAWTPSAISSEDKEVLGDWKVKTTCAAVIRDIDEVIRKTCEFSQRSVSNLFAVRKEVQAVYTMPQLRLLYDTTMDFVVAVEKLTGKTDYTLRGALFSQLKLFLEKYHHAQMAKLVSTLDHELWKNTEISVPRHKALEDLSSGRGVSLTLSDDRAVAGETAAPFKAVAICGKSFRVVWSVLLMLEIVMNYMSCAANFPVLATDVLQRSIEIFRLFNSRTTQLVLGAGAMQIARLKSISTRHLALASQSLDLAMTLIPHIKAALAAHFTDRQKLLLDEFDRVLRDYAEHNEKIFSKFTNIVEDQIMKRFLENVAAEVNYDAASVTIPSNPMKGITQNTLKLHAVLHPVLSPTQMKDVMSRVFDMFSQKLPECFKHVQPKTPTGRSRVLEDVTSFVESFKEVSEMEFNGDALLRHFAAAYRNA
ncbi:hypothetical protein PybrP1_003706 [[Pythium] brassicae (nom. inval.)]|nr:hypothetical protein PybrP1_003706 [[Pythium] brassicae (nom. inval.)]